MSTERYHKAARDGYLDALKEATKRDLNTRDEDGMTPTLWAAFEGNLDALRLVVGRGGDPDKCDHYGNTALHFAAAKGHLNIASFLVNFGVNMWALDIDFHTPKDLAAINNKEEILRFLDTALAREEAKDKKKVKTLQEKAEKDAQKRIKEFDKIQKKLEDEQKKLAKERERMEKYNSHNNSTVRANSGGILPSKPGFLSLRKDPKVLYGNGGGGGSGSSDGPKFSQIVQNKGSSGTTNKIKTITSASGVLKKVQQRNKTMSGKSGNNGTVGGEFKITEVESDGKRSLRSLSGLRRDSEIIYVPKYDVQPNGGNKRGKIADLFDEHGSNSEIVGNGTDKQTPLTRSLSQPDYLHQITDENEIGVVGGRGSRSSNDDLQSRTNPVSIFERPGFGSVAFRHNFSAANFLKSREEADIDENVVQEEDEDEYPDIESGPIEVFLEASGLSTYTKIFVNEKIDIDTLMLLTESDLASLGIEMGPRRKILKAIKERRDAIENPGEIIDSRL